MFGLAASDSTARRTLAVLDEAALGKIAKVRARVRRHVWRLLHLRPGGFPGLTVAGKRLYDLSVFHAQPPWGSPWYLRNEQLPLMVGEFITASHPAVIHH
ncbi:hypothetical protein AB0D37_44205 [Streptomyces sp. NPDC048384]|uniref:hypothetical protein n=1 Tax=Streptomyces sp. NPDC048384 TaxID=3155487 RepID=UPI0034140A90